MLILALDTTTRAGSCALVRDGGVVREAGSDPEQPPAARLPRDLMQLLDAAELTLDAIDAFAVATGPGSFTGLRIGIATMQGLAFAQRKPLFGISGFDALAASVGDGDRFIAPWVDAWRGEVYAALYRGPEERVPPVVAPPRDVLEGLARSGDDRVWFAGDGAAAFASEIRDVLGTRAAFAEPVSPLIAGAIGRLAAHRATAGERPLPHAISPLYVRRSDAELARNRR